MKYFHIIQTRFCETFALRRFIFCDVFPHHKNPFMRNIRATYELKKKKTQRIALD